ncbi:MAG: hypothetical protein LBP56_10480 [Odoribacteraceae bacterium]|jgi:hypothetical protein|nr:hypothetical protein [Odoribacteraceae bacterium]
MLKRKKKASVSPFVPCIYDYCDRWCDRCTFTSRCLNFAIDRKLQEVAGDSETGELPAEDEDDGLGYGEDPENGIIREIARERGVSVEVLVGGDSLGDLRTEFEDAESDDEDDEASLLLSEEDVYSCFCLYERLIDEDQEELYLLIDAMEEASGEGSQAEYLARVNRIEDSLSEINWYLDLLYAKLKRAYYAASFYISGGNERALADANGSAKVVLLAVAASTSAWVALREELPEVRGKIEWLLVILEQIHDDVTCRFPDARTFKRPGFDE